MSSFKRKSTSKTEILPGTRTSPGSITNIITSTGVPSLDDILGGGLPLSCSLVVAAPDPHSSYGELVQKTFVSQGLACTQDVLVVGSNQDALEWVKGCMWFHNSVSSNSSLEEGNGGQEPENAEQKIKIAWRYEQMKQFQTTVGSASVSEDFCRTFDLTTRIPSSTIEKALQDGRLITCDVLDIFDSIPSSGPIPAIHKIIAHIEEILSQRSSKPNIPLRICIPGLGNHIWDELRSQDVLRFFHQLRSLLRRNPLACASISLDPRISTEAWGGPGWIQKLGWMCDGLITLDAFTTNPSLSSLFPSHHGMVYIHTLPSPRTLLSPSDRFSTLRGLSASVSEGGNSSGENNLAFKCTRKRLIFETMHLDVEGGVGERRITPAPVTNVIDNSARVTTVVPVSETSLASVKIEVELEPVAEVKAARISSETAFDNNGGSVVEEAQERKQRLKKPKKTVAFFSDRPDLYDF